MPRVWPKLSPVHGKAEDEAEDVAANNSKRKTVARTSTQKTAAMKPVGKARRKPQPKPAAMKRVGKA